MDDNSVIMLAVVVTAGSTLIAEQQKSSMTFKPVIGGWLLGLFLFVIATFNAKLARMFAILVMVSAVLVNGSSLFGAVNKATGATTITGGPRPTNTGSTFSRGSLTAV